MCFVILLIRPNKGTSLYEGMNLELLPVLTFCNHFWRCLLAKEYNAGFGLCLLAVLKPCATAISIYSQWFYLKH